MTQNKDEQPLPATREEMLAELLRLYEKLDEAMQRRDALNLRRRISDRIKAILESLKEELPLTGDKAPQIPPERFF